MYLTERFTYVFLLLFYPSLTLFWRAIFLRHACIFWLPVHMPGGASKAETTADKHHPAAAIKRYNVSQIYK